jgi:REP element-mobilizing transposase RayT
MLGLDVAQALQNEGYDGLYKMKFDHEKHYRRSLRLKRYDYFRAGGYFVTIVTQNRECLFGDIVEGEMVLNRLGEILSFTWNDLPNHNQNIKLDEFSIMPNHIHGIIIIVGAGSEPAPTLKKSHGLPEIVRQFKTFSAKRINKQRCAAGTAVWQRNYYEHVVRDETDLNSIREYIVNNPKKWELDDENPNRNNLSM